MKLIVRKMPEYVLHDSFSQIKDMPDYHECYAGNAMETFFASMQMAENKAHLNIEDDVILCNNFMDRVMDVVNKHPDKLISFFTLKKSVKGPTMMPGSSFCMNQCVYYPDGWTEPFLSFFDGWERILEHPTGYDYAMADFMKSRHEKYLLWQPSLVQHRAEKSRIDPRRSTKRQSITFNMEGLN